MTLLMDKSQYVDKCMALLHDTKVYKPCRDYNQKNYTEMSRKPFNSSTETMGTQDYTGGANATKTNCSPWATASPSILWSTKNPQS